MNPEIEDALARANQHLNWLHGLQAEPGHSPKQDPDLEAAINKYQSQYNDLEAIARKPGADPAQQAATLAGLEASARETDARAAQIRAQTGQIGAQTPDNAANNATSLQVAGIQAGTAAANRTETARQANQDFTIKDAQNQIARDQLELARQQAAAKEKVQKGEWDEAQAVRELTAQENALNRSLEVYKTQVQQEANTAGERNAIRQTEASTRNADVNAGNQAGTDALNAYKDFMSQTTTAGLGDYMKSIWDNGGDTTKIGPFTPQGNKFDLNALVEGARARERGNLQGFASPQYNRNEQPGGPPQTPIPNLGGTPPSNPQYPSGQDVMNHPQSFLTAPEGADAGPQTTESPDGYGIGVGGPNGEADWQVYSLPPGFDMDELRKRLAAGGQNG